ncbi:MAG: hypothetical protein ACFWT4_04590 [Citrobacter braakii]
MSKQLDNWYFELNTLLEDGTSLYQDSRYHGREMSQEKNGLICARSSPGHRWMR